MELKIFAEASIQAFASTFLEIKLYEGFTPELLL